MEIYKIFLIIVLLLMFFQLFIFSKSLQVRVMSTFSTVAGLTTIPLTIWSMYCFYHVFEWWALLVWPVAFIGIGWFSGIYMAAIMIIWYVYNVVL